MPEAITDATPPEYAAACRIAAAGDHEAAATAFRRSANAAPTHARSHADLGTALANCGRLEEALPAFQRAAELQPPNVNLLANLAVCLERCGRLAEASDRAQAALAIDGNNIPALGVVTRVALQRRNGSLALRGARCLCDLRPSRESHEYLIRSLLTCRRFDEAEIQSEKFIQQTTASLRPGVSRSERTATLGAARLLQARVIGTRLRQMFPTGPYLPDIRRRRLELVQLLQSITNDWPSDEAYLELARAHHACHQHEQAEDAARRAVNARPENAEALEFLGDLLIERSKADEAIACLDSALEHDPCRSKAFLLRVKTRCDEERYGEYHDRLDQLLAIPDAPRVDRTNWYFAKAQLYDRSRDYDRAFENYLAAGRLKDARALQSSPSDASDEAGSPQGHPEDAAANPMAAPPKTVTPTTVDPAAAAATSAKLERHNEHQRACETAFTNDFIDRMASAGNDSRRPLFIVGVPRSGTTLTEQILASHPAVVGGGELPDFSSFGARIAKATDVTHYPDGLAQTTPETLRQYAEEYLAELSRIDPDASRVVDKMPGNLLHVGLIRVMFPNARVIYIRRDPRDVCVSALKNHLDFPFCNLEKTANFCVACDRLGDLWRERFPEVVLKVNYEDLVTDPEPLIRQIIAHAGLEWNDHCLRFHETDRNVRTPSRWQVRKPAYRSSIGAWRRYEGFLHHLTPILGEP